ncbi:HNH endonuclease [Agromyces sp. NPDC058064]|uniref:HNH endonuclease n=1 Tax=Agromyces sp. NPDC058064 TaxID=3346322 RepID=UPI0036D9AA56
MVGDAAHCTCGHCRRYEQAKKDFKTACRKAALPCWLCQQPIDYDLAWPDTESFSLDHFLPRADRPDLTEVWSNFRPAHLSCNSSRGKREPKSMGTPSRAW